MPKGYSHLTYEQICQIYALKQRGDSRAAIAKELGVNRSAISRELGRNSGQKGYRYILKFVLTSTLYIFEG